MKFESITGKSTIYVDQDFRVQVLVYHMLQDIRKEADGSVSVKGRAKGSKYPMHTNENIAIGLSKEQMIKLILETNDVRRGKLLFELREETEEYILPQRKLPGKERKRRIFQINIKTKTTAMKPGFLPGSMAVSHISMISFHSPFHIPDPQYSSWISDETQARPSSARTLFSGTSG